MSLPDAAVGPADSSAKDCRRIFDSVYPSRRRRLYAPGLPCRMSEMKTLYVVPGRDEPPLGCRCRSAGENDVKRMDDARDEAQQG